MPLTSGISKKSDYLQACLERRGLHPAAWAVLPTCTPYRMLAVYSTVTVKTPTCLVPTIVNQTTSFKTTFGIRRPPATALGRQIWTKTRLHQGHRAARWMTTWTISIAILQVSHLDSLRGRFLSKRVHAIDCRYRRRVSNLVPSIGWGNAMVPSDCFATTRRQPGKAKLRPELQEITWATVARYSEALWNLVEPIPENCATSSLVNWRLVSSGAAFRGL